jgi:hypothetical protein
MFNATFVDHSDEINALLKRKVYACVAAAGYSLAKSYREGLQDNTAPEHSRPGQIPHAYAGHQEGGYGPLYEPGQANNTRDNGFARDQGVGSDFLSDYIEVDASGDLEDIKSFVGFAPSHVTTREKNYLIDWDLGTVPGQDGVRRPWIDELYKNNRAEIANEARQAFKDEE